MFNGLLQNFSVYVDGANYVGKVVKAILPKITPKMVEHFGAGMSAPIDLDTGKVEKMEATIEIDGVQKDLYKSIGNSDAALIVRGKIRNDNGENESVIAEMRGYISELDGGDWEPESKGSSNIKMSVHYYKLSIAGDDVVEIDALNGVRKINNTNQLASIL